MTALDIAPFPASGRVHHGQLRVGPGATTPTGRARLDAVVDWLQQVAYEDVVDAGLEGESLWVVRRTQVAAERPVFGERLELRTAASGTGPLVTERRTTITGEDGAQVEAAALWVPLDPRTLRPRRTEAVETVYGPSAAGRRVKARLRHPAPTADAVAVDWRFDRADLDVAGHVNNAAYWRALEEELGEHPAAAPLAAEMEHPAPAFAGPARLLRAGDQRWIVGVDGAVHASALLLRDA